MHKCFFYVGTRILGSSRAAWSLNGEPVDRWTDAMNLFASKYMPKTEAWFYLMNVADQDTVFDGIREFQLFEHFGRWPVKREDPSENPRAALKRWGVREVEPWKRPSVLTTGILSNKVPPGRPPTVDLGDGRTPQNSSGRTRTVLLNPAIASMREQLPFPMFSITDCNTFHTSGYIWGKFALDNAIARWGAGPVLIVNFDQHRDYDATQDLVKSDGWGKPLLKNYQGAFLNFGCTGLNALDGMGFVGAWRRTGQGDPTTVKPGDLDDTNRVTMRDLLGIDPPPANARAGNIAAGRFADAVPKFDVLRQKIPKLIQHLARQAGADAFKYVFLTVDRDCMLYNGTQWGYRDAPFMDYRSVAPMMRMVLEATRATGARLVGLDITGLPEADGVLNDSPDRHQQFIGNMPAPPNELRLLGGLKTELGEYQAIAAKYLVESDYLGPVASVLARELGQPLRKKARPQGAFRGSDTLTFSLSGGGPGGTIGRRRSI